jgi:hypothetical protein
MTFDTIASGKTPLGETGEQFHRTNQHEGQALALKLYLEGIDWVNIGWTKASGHRVIGSSENRLRFELLALNFRSPDDPISRWRDHRT